MLEAVEEKGEGEVEVLVSFRKFLTILIILIMLVNSLFMACKAARRLLRPYTNLNNAGFELQVAHSVVPYIE